MIILIFRLTQPMFQLDVKYWKGSKSILCLILIGNSLFCRELELAETQAELDIAQEALHHERVASSLPSKAVGDTDTLAPSSALYSGATTSEKVAALKVRLGEVRGHSISADHLCTRMLLSSKCYWEFIFRLRCII